MTENFEFELVFGLPEGEHDQFEIADAVYEAGFEDAVVGVADPRMMAVELEVEGEEAEAVILNAARSILKFLPEGSALHEIQPDLVSLADVAEKIGTTRQTLQQRKMPLPAAGGLYRIDEVAEALRVAMKGVTGKRKPRFTLDAASGWLNAGIAARRLNAQMTIKMIDAVSLERTEEEERPASKQRRQVARA